jgi:hypothetical protein
MDVSESDDSEEPVEVYEHIPWAELAVLPREKKPWVVYLAAGAVAAASLGALAARSVGRTPEPPPAAVPPTVTVPVVTTLPWPAPEGELLTEADLLAETPGRGEVSAAARAEWFVTDYFSSGGDPGTDQQVLNALPDGSSLPAATGAGFSSYVEWVATSRIEAVGNQRFRSTVLFRMLVSSGDESYVRMPVRAVDVVVEVDAGGGTKVVDLPMPAGVPAGPPLPTWADPVEKVPDLVRAAALRLARSWGADPTVVEGSKREGGWRVVVGVADEAGVSWPLTLWLTDQGEPAWPAGIGDS